MNTPIKLVNSKDLLNNNNYIIKLKKSGKTNISNDNYEVVEEENILTLDKVINAVSEEELNLIPEDLNTEIYFKNFSTWNKFLKQLKNVGINLISLISNKEFEEDKIAKYSFETEKIEVEETVLKNNTQTNDSIISRLRDKGYSNIDIVNVIILHEIGHAIYHYYYKNNNNNHLGNIQPSSPSQLIQDMLIFRTEVTFSDKEGTLASTLELHKNVHYSLNEGFPDLFACVCLSKVYQKEQSLKMIKDIQEIRQYGDTSYKEMYFTQASIKHFLNDFTDNSASLDFKCFNDFYNYMSNIIVNTSIDMIKKQLSDNKTDTDKVMNNKFLGFINKKLKLNCESANEVIQALNKNYNLDLNIIVPEIAEAFKSGEATLIDEKKHIKKLASFFINNINNIRDKQREDKNINNFKIK